MIGVAARETPELSGAELVDRHLATLPEPQRSTLSVLRATLRRVLPDADECIKYRMPCFAVNGVGVAAYDGFKKHCSYFPMSGNVLAQVGPTGHGVATTTGTLQFPVDRPLDEDLVRRLVEVRLAEISAKHRPRRR
jgi:uncharacterized protein YdhG (YjbR/CyaY superfamily)